MVDGIIIVTLVILFMAFGYYNYFLGIDSAKTQAPVISEGENLGVLDYEVVEASRLTELSYKVLELNLRGWRVQGGVFVVKQLGDIVLGVELAPKRTFYQAMVMPLTSD